LHHGAGIEGSRRYIIRDNALEGQGYLPLAMLFYEL
jgi:hypothetical protein